VDFTATEPRKQGSPWITIDMEEIIDPSTCMKQIMEKYDADAENDFDKMDRAIALAYTKLLEDHLYW
jgi:hypothetical protein